MQYFTTFCSFLHIKDTSGCVDFLLGRLEAGKNMFELVLLISLRKLLRVSCLYRHRFHNKTDPYDYDEDKMKRNLFGGDGVRRVLVGESVMGTRKEL